MHLEFDHIRKISHMRKVQYNVMNDEYIIPKKIEKSII
jgi:hypothetical protein